MENRAKELTGIKSGVNKIENLKKTIKIKEKSIF